MSKSSKSNRHSQATEFKVEFWNEASGRPRRHRSRYYASVEGILRAGARWEARGSDYFCRYWHGLNTWQSSTRAKLVDDPLLARADPPNPIPPAPVRAPGPRPRRKRRDSMKIYSVFGQIEAAVAETMITEGKARRIPVDEIPESVLYNDTGELAKFAIMLPIGLDPEFNRRCKDLRS